MTRVPALLLVALLDAVLAVPLLTRPGPAWIHPLAPPLTRIDALGDRTLGPEPGRPPDLLPALVALERRTGTQVAGLGTSAADAARIPLLAVRAARIRVQVEEDALSLAEALGPVRVGRIVGSPEALSAEVGEGAAWDRAVESLGR